MKVGTDGVLLGAWANVDGATRVLDIGTGTGIVALMIAQRNPHALIDAVEIDEQSSVQARQNFFASPWNHRLCAYHSDFHDFALNSEDKSYALIVSNPPYFLRSTRSQNPQRNLGRHAHALPYDVLLSGVSRLLRADGKFCGIFPYSEGNIFIAKASNFGLFCTRKLNVASKPGRSTLRVLLQFELMQKPLDETSITIHGFDGGFSEEYRALTRDFYLAF